MNTNDEMAAGSQTVSSSGFENLRLTDGDASVKVTIGSMARWDRSHLRRLRQSADLPGLVPVIDSDLSSDDKPFAVTPMVDHPRLSDRIPPDGGQWPDCAAIVEASARSLHEAHLRGLFHGSLSPDQIYVINDDTAVEGVGLGLGGNIQPDYHHWTAPEVLDGADATERSDVYSLGKILEAALGNNIEDVPRSVRRLIMWSSSDTPEARPPSALEFASILAEALGDERRIYSPAFIPTADVNALAATASAEVAAYQIADIGIGSGSGLAAAAGTAAVGAVAANQLLDDDEPELDDPAAGLEVVEDDVEDLDEVAGADDEVEGIDVDADVDEVVEFGDESVEDDLDIEDKAVITDEIPAVADDATTTIEVDADDDDIPAGTSTDFDSRDYTAAAAATTTSDSYEVPAAQTVEIVNPQERNGRSNRAGILVGVIAAAVLALIGWQLLNRDSTGDDVANPAAEQAAESEADSEESVSSEDSAPEAPATAEEEPAAEEEAVVEEEPVAEEEAVVEEEPVAEEEAVVEEEPVAEEEAVEEEAAAEEEEPVEEEPVEPAQATTPLLEGPISANDAAIQIVHGIPDATVDVYVDGQALAPGFAPGTIAGPIALDPGDYQVDIYAASDTPPAAAADRDDSPLLSESVAVGATAASLYAHLGEQGAPMLSAFGEEFSTLAPGQGRAVARHLAAAPEVTLLVDGEPVGTLANGASFSADLAAGSHDFAIQAGDAEVLAATLDIADGEVVVVSVTGSANDGTLAPVVQRYSGLSSAPTEVPTGDSDLLGMDEDLTSLYIVGVVAVAMAFGGLAVMTRRRRIL